MDAWARLRSADHAVFGTVNADRGVDLVPVVFALDDEARVWIPVDTVKSKRGGRLGRERNLETDPRCSLLVQNYDDDWRSLWWVRLHGTATMGSPSEWPQATIRLSAKYPQYRAEGSIARLMTVDVTEVSSWAAE